MTEKSTDEIFDNLKDLGVTAPNPIVRQMSALAAIMLDTFRDRDADGFLDQRELEIYDARISVALQNLEKIPDEVWSKWCELPKDKVIPQFSEIYRSFGRPKKN